MTYVSRRARITVPRWPNEFDPEFLFRVGRRCDGRLKRHSSCHDLRAWINDNCIKNEYLLDLMSDGEVTLRPPLQLYGRFIPVPLLFKLLQNSRPEGGANNVDSNEISQRSGASEFSEGDRYNRKGPPTPNSERASRKSPATPNSERDGRRSPATPNSERDGRRSPATPNSERDGRRSPATPNSEDERDFRKKGNVYWANRDQRESNSGFSFMDSDKSKASGATISKGRGSLNAPDEETHSGKVFGEGEDFGFRSSQNIPRGVPVQRKWDPFEKMEYYTSGLASKDALMDGATPRPVPTESTVVMNDEDDDDDDENKRNKIVGLRSEREGSLARILWEKDLAEKNLFKSTCLLTKALGKLEKIDNIIQVANDEREKIRKGEIQEAFHKPTINCIYLTSHRPCEQTPTSGIRYRVKSQGDQERQNTLKCNELLRQISGLREKLKKNQECQQRVNQEITMSQKDAESGTSPYMTDLNTEEGEVQTRKLQKRLEKLINHRGKLLSEMCQALSQLNSLKRCRSSKPDLRQRSRSGENRSTNMQCTCPCRVCQSSESEKVHCSDSESSTDNQFRRTDVNYNRNDDKNYHDYSSNEHLDSGQQNLNNENSTRTTLNGSYASNGELHKDYRQEKERRKSILRFCCPNPPCKQDLDADYNASERQLHSGQRSPRGGPSSGGNSPYRPNTSPTTEREKLDASEERRFFPYGGSPQGIPERRVKSETTMKEIEKTLRNYEQRLNNMEGLEYKVEEWKRKLLEACRWKKSAWKAEEQMKKDQEDERNKATIEINGLFSQNYELKKQIRQLMDKSKEQAKKIQNMRSSVMKARELECEAEELKKELSEYRTSYENQRKCISKWESVVALQRKEIENLMNHIRKLTTEKKEQMNVYSQERKCIQRTRSCSPVNLVDCQSYCGQESCNMRSDEENGSCCCQDFRQPDSRRKFFDKNYYSSFTKNDDWCN